MEFTSTLFLFLFLPVFLKNKHACAGMKAKDVSQASV
jgi:hypothetical protein